LHDPSVGGSVRDFICCPVGVGPDKQPVESHRPRELRGGGTVSLELQRFYTDGLGDDLADACVYLLRNYDAGGIINVGSGQEISIRDLALLMKSVVGYDGEVEFDSTRPDGTPRKIMDNSKLRTHGWRPTLTIEAGLKKMYAWFVESLADDC